MELPEGAKLAYGEKERIESAVAALAADEAAPRELTVRVLVHIHKDYPKHVTVGKNEDGTPITKVVQNADEEKALAPAPTSQMATITSESGE